MKLSRLILIILVLVLAILIGFLVYTKPFGRQTTSNQVNLAPITPYPTGVIKAPTPYLILPQGKQEFQIRTGASNEPVGTRIIADPLDAPKGTTQTVSLDIEYSKPITAVNAVVTTDTMQKTYPLKLTAGTQTNGTWTGTWTMEDTHEKIFTIQFSISYSDKQSIINFPIR